MLDNEKKQIEILEKTIAELKGRAMIDDEYFVINQEILDRVALPEKKKKREIVLFEILVSELTGAIAVAFGDDEERMRAAMELLPTDLKALVYRSWRREY